MRLRARQVLTSGGRPAAGQSARRGRPFAGTLLLLGSMVATVLAQTTAVNDAFDEVDRDAGAHWEASAEQPFADDPQNENSDSNPQLPQGLPQVRALLQWGGGKLNAAATQAAETLPPPRVEGRVPLAGPELGEEFEMSRGSNGMISLVVRDKPLSHVLAALAQAHGLNIVASNDIDALISITLHEVPLEEALNAILAVANYTWVKRGNIILITSLNGAANLPPDVQGRQIQVFDLDFASATTVAESVTGFLSPIGKVTVSESDPADNRMTRELVIVEDLPESLARIAGYIAQVDCPPRQVLIEAHILQVTLDDTTRCGVDLHALLRMGSADVNIFSIPSLASGVLQGGGDLGVPNPLSPPASVATFSSNDLQAVIDMLQTTTDAKSLGSPKVLVLNEQQASLQVGDQLSFRVTTTTETSSLESVQFLDVGVILRITPRITRDGRVLLYVEPEVSSGAINPDSGLPETSRTNLQTNVMLRDGQGMVIGGLIKEIDSVQQSKIPYLGDVKGLGWFFRRSEITKERVEIIVTLVPRIQPYEPCYQAYEQGELVKAGVPLMQGPLCRTDRPWDPILPDGKRVYRSILPWRPVHTRRLPSIASTSEYIVTPTPLPQQHFYDNPCPPGSHAPAMSPLHRAFLSDEAGPPSHENGGTTYGPEIIRERD